AAAVRMAMHSLARRFVGGHTTEEAVARLVQLRGRNLAATLDLLGEVTLSHREANVYQQRYLALLEQVSPQVAEWEDNPLLDRINGRPAPRLNLSVKLSAFCPQLEPAA
ncbi:MAG: hypothetical protein GWO24_32650, partial [Akkermansiaceae bacterium]|nr:hypothetical protein [Akkermansiaceae bacterium]